VRVARCQDVKDCQSFALTVAGQARGNISPVLTPHTTCVVLRVASVGVAEWHTEILRHSEGVSRVIFEILLAIGLRCRKIFLGKKSTA
jgi:hypothetical protein